MSHPSEQVRRGPRSPSRRWGTRSGGDPASEEAFGAAEVAGGADVGEGEVEAVGVFIADGAELVLAVLDGEAAAVPVVAGLDGGVLDGAEVDVDAGVGGEGEAGAVGVAEAAEDTHLFEVGGGRTD